MTTSNNNGTNWKQAAQDYFTSRGKLNLAAGAVALEGLQDNAEQRARYQDAEQRAAFQKVWGREIPETGDDDMRQTILGNQTIYQNDQKKTAGLSKLAALALVVATGGTAGLAGTIGGWLISQALQPDTPPAVHQPADDETVDIGLGRIENFQPNE